MTYYLRIAAVVLLLCVMGSKVSAEQFSKRIVAGVVEYTIEIIERDAWAEVTKSVSLRREDTGVTVMCIAAVNGVTVTGLTPLLTDLGPDLVLRAYAHSLTDCEGVTGEPSDNSYLVLFAAPGKPVLYESTE